MSELAKVINSADNEEALKNALADFHLLCFIQSTDIMSPEEFRELCQIVTQFNSDIKRLNELNGWKTLELLLKETGEPIDKENVYDSLNFIFFLLGTKSASGTKNNLPAEISCRHCTFMNPSSNESCEMCGLPLSG